MDINLKSSNGLVLTRKVTALDPAARVIIVIQYDEPAYRNIAANVGAIGYILKDNIRINILLYRRILLENS